MCYRMYLYLGLEVLIIGDVLATIVKGAGYIYVYTFIYIYRCTSDDS
jgi:hypothetical protein